MAPIGLTKDAGWQIGASRTLRAQAADVWDVLTTDDALAIWTAPGLTFGDLAAGGATAPDGTVVEVRSLHERERIRLRCTPPGRRAPYVLQATLEPRPTGCTLRLHMERLSGPAERERMRQGLKVALARIESMVGA